MVPAGLVTLAAYDVGFMHEELLHFTNKSLLFREFAARPQNSRAVGSTGLNNA